MSRRLIPAVIRMLPLALAVMLIPDAHAAGSKYRVLHNFGSGNDGSFPAGPLVLDAAGNLYGATGGGDAGCKGDGSGGTVFELAKQRNGTWSESVLYCFGGQWTDGSPNSGLIIDSKGDLFGTSAGGTNDLSNVFELTPGAPGWNFSVLYNLGGANLLLDQKDNIYGYLGPGSYKAGAVAELAPNLDGWSYSQLYSFGGNGGGDGFGPSVAAAPSWDSRGNLYGTTLYGGNSQSSGHNKFCQQGLGCGVVFRMTPNGDGTWTYHVLHRFANFATDGQNPDGGLVVDASGNAYGVTAYGGVNGNGTVFEFSPSSDGHWKE